MDQGGEFSLYFLTLGAAFQKLDHDECNWVEMGGEGEKEEGGGVNVMVTE